MRVLRQPPLAEGLTQDFCGRVQEQRRKKRCNDEVGPTGGRSSYAKLHNHHCNVANGINNESRAIPTLRWHRRLCLIRIKMLATFEA